MKNLFASIFKPHFLVDNLKIRGITKKIFLILILYFNISVSTHFNIGLCIMATGKYIQFAQDLIQSARKYFCVNHSVTYFVFTDGEIDDDPDIIKICQKRLGWPFDTMMRFQVYFGHSDLLSRMDYLFALDADMLFVDYVDDEILGKLVATQHPGFTTKRGSYETENPKSKAFVEKNRGFYYFAGGFYGGTAEEFLRMCNLCSSNIQDDLKNKYIAVWHDESHLNRYFIDNPPTVVLSPSYCYPEKWNLPYKKRLLALDKNHAEMRK